MDFELSEPARRLRGEIRPVFARERPAVRVGYRRKESEDVYAEDRALRIRLAQYGWFGIGIPEEYGGRGGSLEERYVVAAEFAYHAVPCPRIAMNMVGPMLCEMPPRP